MKVFNLPDLGEGLPDAEIVEWLVAEGDEVKLDQPLVSMETAKAVVEVPSPYAGRVVKFHGQAGDVIQTGAPLAEFSVAGDDQDTGTPAPGGAESEPADDPSVGDIGDDELDLSSLEAPADRSQPETASADEPSPEDAPGSDQQEEPAEPEAPEPERADTGTVVGNVQSSNEVLHERTSTIGGVKVTPAVRALARKLKVDISRVTASGTGGVVTAADVRQAAEHGLAPIEQQQPSTSSPQPAAEPAPQDHAEPMPESRPETEPVGAAEQPQSASSPEGEWEPVRGTRRTMARVMSESHKSVVPTTLMDDADIQAWRPGEDITVRLLRALWAGAQAEPGLNAWFRGEDNVRMIHKNMHVGMAVDTPDGLFVAALRNVNKADKQQLRGEINRLRENVQNRSIPPEDLKDYTIILSNFGKFAGRYATPVITPPCVAIVAAGKLRHEVVPVLGGVEVHRMIPLSLTFDHRASTGGEAARFLKAMLDDLASPD